MSQEVDPRRQTLDLLILDKAHHIAPSAPKQRYVVDSQQAKLSRSFFSHCEHRLFLTRHPAQRLSRVGSVSRTQTQRYHAHRRGNWRRQLEKATFAYEWLRK